MGAKAIEILRPATKFLLGSRTLNVVIVVSLAADIVLIKILAK